MCNCKCNCGATQVNVGPKGDTGATGETGPQGEPGGQLEQVVKADAGTLTLTPEQTGALVVFDRASGSIVTLPNTPDDGTNYTFQTKTDLSSNNYVINAGTLGLDSFSGYVWAKKAGANDEIFATSAATAITFNGGTKGGDVGGSVHVVYSEDENKWYVSGYTNGAGALATPFS